MQSLRVRGSPELKVTDDLWTAIVPAEFQQRVVCLCCFDDFALARRIDYTAAVVELVFAGRKAALILRPTAAVNV
jgi:hypothetical protein